jgi:hypothetical protein
MLTAENAERSRWAQAWPAALAFAGGLAVAWFADWETTDLVWSLWLSSLVVGYSITRRISFRGGCWERKISRRLSCFYLASFASVARGFWMIDCL